MARDWDYPVDRFGEHIYDEDQEQVVACRYCGETDLVWEQRGARWHLFKMRGLTLSPHTCKPKNREKLQSSAFDDLDA